MGLELEGWGEVEALDGLVARSMPKKARGSQAFALKLGHCVARGEGLEGMGEEEGGEGEDGSAEQALLITRREGRDICIDNSCVNEYTKTCSDGYR